MMIEPPILAGLNRQNGVAVRIGEHASTFLAISQLAAYTHSLITAV